MQAQKQKTSTNNSICGAETSKGGKCQNKAESCPWHDEDGNTLDNNAGRKGKYSEERVNKILEAAENGLPMRSLARAGAIETSTLYEWMDKYPEFSEQVKEARTKAEMKLAKQARQKDPRYILTRSFKWDKPSADTVINNQMSQSQMQEQSVSDKLAEYYREKMEEQKQQQEEESDKELTAQ